MYHLSLSHCMIRRLSVRYKLQRGYGGTINIPKDQLASRGINCVSISGLIPMHPSSRKHWQAGNSCRSGPMGKLQELTGGGVATHQRQLEGLPLTLHLPGGNVH